MMGAALLGAMMQVIVTNPPDVLATRDLTENGEAWQIIAEDGEFVERGEALKRGTTIARQRLVPKRLVVVSGDIERADGGDRWAQAGDQLFGARVGDLDAYCVLDAKMNVTVGMLFVPTRTRLVKIDCFVDRDGDGRLDQRFEADPGIGVLPNVARSEPQAFYDLAPVAYTVIDSREFADDSWVEIEFRGEGRRNDDRPRFRVSYRYDGRTRRLSDEIRGQSAPFPNLLDVLGAQIALDQRDDGKLTASILRPMNSSFGVVTRLDYR